MHAQRARFLLKVVAHWSKGGQRATTYFSTDDKERTMRMTVEELKNRLQEAANAGNGGKDIVITTDDGQTKHYVANAEFQASGDRLAIQAVAEGEVEEEPKSKVTWPAEEMSKSKAQLLAEEEETKKATKK